MLIFLRALRMIRKTSMKRTGFAKPRAPAESGILRTADLPGIPAAPKLPAKPKTSKCKICRSTFVKRSMMHRACSPDCATALVARDKKVVADKAVRADKVQTRKQLESLKSIPKLKAEAQTACNAYIRYRDRNQPCICCNGMPLTNGALNGGQFDACHYRGRGAADHLRYNEDNIHRGLKNCNTYGHTDYRGGLIARIGLARVEALEADQAIVKWTPELLRSIRDGFKAKLKALMAAATEEGV